ncbi:MAG: DsbA family oxidoreductase [Actinobacteria bacterium]|nr:DsbA family oxidoreductase [Actinomycetota bacterium]
MRVEIWSDVVCPWCYIGKRRFETALSQFEHADEVEVVWRSFELDPDAPPRRGSSAEHLMRKYGWTAEQVAASNERLRGLAGAERLDYRLEETQGGNTFDAHRLIHAAAAAGRGDEMKERLLRAYFTEGVAVGDRQELVDVASPVVPDAAEVLASDRHADEVRADEREARVLGIHGVPFFVFDRRYAVEGAQASEVILGALRQAWSERAAA